MTNDFDIANLALTRLGAAVITSLADGSRNATVMNQLYATIRDEVLKAHPWKFATRRASLAEHDANILTITNISNADPGVVSYTGTDPENGDEYLIESVTGMTEVNDGVYIVANVNTVANTFELLDVDTTLFTPYGANGTATEQIPHTVEFEYLFDLPADCLRVFAINDDWDAKFEVDPVGLLTNESECDIIYCRQVTTVSRFDVSFCDALAWRLAMEAAVSITGSTKKLQAAAQMYALTLARAERYDASEKQGGYPAFSRYRDARR